MINMHKVVIVFQQVHFFCLSPPPSLSPSLSFSHSMPIKIRCNIYLKSISATLKCDFMQIQEKPQRTTAMIKCKQVYESYLQLIHIVLATSHSLGMSSFCELSMFHFICLFVFFLVRSNIKSKVE